MHLVDWLRRVRVSAPHAVRGRVDNRRRRLPYAIPASIEPYEARLLLSCANNQPPVHPYPGGLGLGLVPWNTPVGKKLATLTASDPDGGPVTFRLQPGAPSTNDGFFAVDAQTGDIWLQEPLGRDWPWSGGSGFVLYAFNVEVFDACGATSSSTISVMMSISRDGWEVREADVDPGDGSDGEEPWCPDCTQPVYDGEGNPHPILHFDVDVAYDPPAYYEATLTARNGGAAVTVANATRFDVGPGMGDEAVRMAFQFDASAFQTGFHAYTLEVTARDENGVALGTRTVDGRVAIANRRESAAGSPNRDGEFGNRRWLSFLDRLDVDEATAGGVGLIRGDGTYEFFAGTGGTYASPADIFETLTRQTSGGGVEYLLESPQGWTKHFDAAGLLKSVKDRNGRVLESFAYDERDGDGLFDELVSYTQADGHVATYAYTAGRLSSSSNGRGATYTYLYNSDGTLASTSGPPAVAGGPTPTISYTYHPGTKLLHTKTGIKGEVTTVTYDAHLRVATIDRPEAAVETVTPSHVAGLTGLVPVGEVVSERTVDGLTWSRSIDSLGNVRSETDPDGNTTAYVRDFRGLVREVRTVNPANPTGPPLVTKYNYNARGRVTMVTHPDGSYRAYTYGANGLDLLTERDERGKIWTYTNDAAGNRLTATGPNGKVTTYTYDARGNLETVTSPDPDGGGPLTASVVSYDHDAYDRVTKVTNPDLTARTYTYDPVTGNVASETDERNNTTAYEYDPYGRVSKVTLPDPDRVVAANGTVISNGSLTSPVWTYVWCACGALKSQTDPLGRTTTYSYDATTGLLTSVTSPDPDLTTSGNGPRLPLKTKYEYDSLGRLWKVSNAVEDPDAAGTPKTVYEYDGQGRLERVTQPDPDGSGGSLLAPVWDYDYDALGRLVSVTGPDPDATTAGAGPLLRPVTEYTYDALGRVLTEKDPTGRVATYFYLPDGRVEKVGAAKTGASTSVPGPLTEFAYDDAGRVTLVTDPLGLVTGYTYDAIGRTSSVTTGAATAASAPVIVTAQGTGGSGLVKAYDAAGNVVFAFDPFASDATAVRVALGDVNGDGYADVVVSRGAAAGVPSLVRIYDGRPVPGSTTPALLAEFTAFEVGYAGGVEVAVADVTGDGVAEILVAPEAARPDGQRSEVRVFEGMTGRVLSRFAVGGTGYTAGVRLAAGDLDGDGKAEVVVGKVSGADVYVYDALTATQKATWTAFAGFSGGVYVAAGDVTGTDGKAEVIVGQGAGGSTLQVFTLATSGSTWTASASGSALTPFASFTGGVRVAAVNGDSDAALEILAGRASGADGYVVLEAGGSQVLSGSSGWSLTGGVSVAGGYRVPARAALATAYTYDANGRVLTETTNGQTTTYEYDAAGNVTKVTAPDPDGAPKPAPVVAAGQSGGTSKVRVIEADGALRYELDPYPTFAGQARVAAADVNGDGIGDVVVVPGTGFTSSTGDLQVKVYDGRTGALLAQFDAYAGHTTGLFVAAADVNGDGLAEVIVSHEGAVSGQTGSNVKVFDALTGRLVSTVAVFSSAYTGGVRVTAADVTGDGKAELVVALPSGQTPAVRVVDALNGSVLAAWLAYGSSTTHGVLVAAADVDGDGKAEVITAPGAGVSAEMKIWDVDPDTATSPPRPYIESLKKTFTAFNPTWTGGVTVGAADINGDGYQDVVVGLAAGSDPAWRAYDVTLSTPAQITGGYAYAAGSFSGGIWVGGGAGRADARALQTSYEYDALGRVTKRTEAFAGARDWQKKVTTYAYDALDRLTSLTDASGNVTSWTYDGLGRVLTETDPRAEVTTYTYDAGGDLASKTDRQGRVTEYDFDALGRITEERWKSSLGVLVTTVSYAYDALGRLLTAATDVAGTAEGDSTLTWTYDAAGRVLTAGTTGTGLPSSLLTNTYDALGRRDKLSATAGGQADFENTYGYDDAGRMTWVVQAGQAGGRAVAGKRVELEYDALGRLSEVTRRAGTLDTAAVVAATQYAYDPRGRLTRITHSNGLSTPAVIADYGYGYDAADRLLWGRTGSDTVTYSYDPTGQLTGGDHTGQTDETYGYDKTGNRLSNGGSAAAGNRLTEDATHAYQYDDEGNLTRETLKADGSYVEYTWDHRNRLTKAEFRTSGGALTKVVAYDYDALNRLVRRRVDSAGDGIYETAQKFVYDGTQAVLVFDDAGNVTDRMLWGPQVDQLFSDESSVDGVLWALTDNLGSVRDLMTYDSGAGTTSVAGHLDYDAFGNAVAATASGVAPLFRFTGRFYDDVTGKQWNLHRWYDSRAGRWLSQDPIGFAAGDANLSRYVGNGPANATDPNGLEGDVLTAGDLIASDASAISSNSRSIIDQLNPVGITTSIIDTGYTIVLDGVAAASSTNDLSILERGYVVSGAALGESLGAGNVCSGVYGKTRDNRAVSRSGTIYLVGKGVVQLGGLVVVARGTAALASSRPVIIYKAPNRGLGPKLATNGFDPADFPKGPYNDGKAYFAKQRCLAEDYARNYGQGILEVRVPRSVYDARLRPLEIPYQGGPFIQVPVPQSEFPVLNASPRTLYPF